MMRRRAFLAGTLSTAVVGTPNVPAAAAAQDTAGQLRPEPLVWPVVKVQPDIRTFAGHADTVPDIVGRIGAPPSLAIFTEGNHLMVLLSDDIVGAFPAWAKSQPQYADLDLENVIVVTLPQPVVVQMIRTGGIALGNLTLEVSRRSGFYPDIVMAGPEPLREVRKLGAIEPQARFFSRNRGPPRVTRSTCARSAGNSCPDGYCAHRRQDCVAQCGRGGGAREISFRDRRADRKSGMRCPVRCGGSRLPRTPRHRASRPP